MLQASKKTEAQITYLIVTWENKSLLLAFLNRAFNTDSSLCEKNKDSPCDRPVEEKKKSYRENLKKVMKLCCD